LAGIDLRYQRQTVLEMARPADEGIAPAAASAVSAHASAKPAAKTAATPPAHTRSAIQRGKISSIRKPVNKPVKRSNATQKPVHKTTTHRDTQG
ncbi:MAG TPA: hypothetical protein VE218_08105, partial [Acidobacteriaceae bacterium]|nr:hypothetical protein [Acidobacteriaceae bacterium]